MYWMPTVCWYSILWSIKSRLTRSPPEVAPCPGRDTHINCPNAGCLVYAGGQHEIQEVLSGKPITCGWPLKKCRCFCAVRHLPFLLKDVQRWLGSMTLTQGHQLSPRQGPWENKVFIQQICIECLLGTRCYSRVWDRTVGQTKPHSWSLYFMREDCQ